MKSEADRHLIDLATSVADGTSIDWDREAAATASDADRELIDGLRLLERIAEVHTGPSPDVVPVPAAPTPPFDWGGLSIMEIIGRGATGVVYRAWDGRLQRHVALKLLQPRGATHATETLSGSEIVSEGRLLARLRHPHVVTVFGADQIDGRVGLWMELVEGRTLADDVLARGPLPAGEVQLIGAQVADALAAVHAAGLVHRDVKAQNVMRDQTGRTVLMDFGTGLDVSVDADVASVAGTPLYLAPEVIAGGAATPRSDVYALGVLLFHLLTAAFPVIGNTLREVRRAHARGDRRALASARPDVPRALARVIDRALAAAPAERYADAAAMAAALRADGERSSRRRRHVALAGAMLVVGLAGAVTAWWLSSGDRSPSAAGLTWTLLPAEFIRAANLRGPAVDGEWAPCSSPRGSQNVALCNVKNRQVRVFRAVQNGARGQPAGRSLVSPDGKRLAYVWPAGLDQTGDTLNVIHVDGTNPRILLSPGTSVAIDEWTADGRALLGRTTDAQGGHYAVLVPVDGEPSREILRLKAGDRRLSLSPDRRTLVVERQTHPGNADLIAIDLPGGAEAWRYERPTNDYSPVWQPDGRAVVFVSNPDGCGQILRLAIDGSVPGAVSKQHELGPQHAELYGFGAAGSLFVQLSDRDRTTFVAPIDLGRAVLGPPRALQSDCGSVVMGAHWHRDGNRVAAVRGSRTPDLSLEVVVTDPLGRTQAAYPIPGRWNHRSEARWSPDGRSIAVTHTPARTGAPPLLSVVDADRGGRVREVARAVESGAGLRRPRWDSTGRYLFFQNIVIRRLDLRTNVNKAFRHPREEAGGLPAFLPEAGFDVAPDTSMAFGVSAPGTPLDCRLRIVEPDGRAIDRHVFTGQTCHGITWNRDASRLLVATFTNSGPPVASLSVLQRASGEPILLTAETRPFHDLSLSPDDTQVLLVRGSGTPSWGVLRGIDGLTPPRAPRPAVPAAVQPLISRAPPEVVLSGRVTGREGQPLAGLYVSSNRRTIRDGRPIFTLITPAVPTDADGRFRLTGRPPGEYVLFASPYISLTGGGVELRAPPPVVGPGGVRLAYVGTPYRAPGSTSPAPTPVRVDSGERTGLDIQLERRPVFDLRGSVVGLPSGYAAPIAIVANVVFRDPEFPPTGRRTDLTNGTFVFRDLPEGTYRIALQVGALTGQVDVTVAGRAPKPVRLVLREAK